MHIDSVTIFGGNWRYLAEKIERVKRFSPKMQRELKRGISCNIIIHQACKVNRLRCCSNRFKKSQ